MLMLTFNINCFTLLSNRLQEEKLKMSKIVIKSDDLYRFSKLVDNEGYIRIEIKNHKAFMIASNEVVACVKYFGDSFDTNEIVYIKIDEKFRERIEFDSRLLTPVVLETMPEFALATLKTDKDISESLIYLDESFYDNWRSWFTESSENKGFMFWDIYQVIKLFECSPSGQITFPAVINSSKPVLLKDVTDSDWAWVFIPAAKDEKKIKPAELPEWLKDANNT